MSFNDWNKYSVGEILDVKHGFAFKGEFFSETPTQYVLLTPGNFHIGGGFKADKLKYYNGEVPNDYILKAGDIVVTMTDLSKDGDTLGYSAKIPPDKAKNYLHNQRLGLLIFKDNEVDKEFIYWLLRTKEYQSFIVNSATGSTVRHTSPSRIKEYEFFTPPLPTQRRIAAILAALDDKIELNRRMNRTLEGIAQAIFREWFVRFNFPGATGEMVETELGEAPKGWRIGKLAEVANIRSEVAKPCEISAENNYVGLEHIPRKTICLDEWENGDGLISHKSKFSKNDILFGKLRPYFHKVGIAPIDGICSTDILVIQPKSKDWMGFCLFHFASEELISFASAVADGTRMPRTSWKDISNYEVALPPKEIADKFNQIIMPLIEKINAHIFQNRTLSCLRDSLLPRLMRGEIAV